MGARYSKRTFPVGLCVISDSSSRRIQVGTEKTLTPEEAVCALRAFSGSEWIVDGLCVTSDEQGDIQKRHYVTNGRFHPLLVADVSRLLLLVLFVACVVYLHALYVQMFAP